MSFSFNPKIITDGLIFYYDITNTKCYSGSGTILKDLSGNSNTGSIVGSLSYSGDSLAFPGIPTNVISITNINNKLSISSGFTYNIFFKSGTGMSTSDIRGLIANSTHALPCYGSGFSMRSNQFFMYAGDGNGNRPNYFFGRVIDETIYQAAIVYDNGTYYCYQNGVLTGTYVYNTAQNNTNFVVGRWGAGYSSDYYFNGLVYNAQVYNRALSQEEIKQNFNSLRGRFNL